MRRRAVLAGLLPALVAPVSAWGHAALVKSSPARRATLTAAPARVRLWFNERIAGVLLVFSYLIVPALAGVASGGRLAARLWIGWAFGTVVSVIGMVASAAFDLPTGATVACAFGVTLLAWTGLARQLRQRRLVWSPTP